MHWAEMHVWPPYLFLAARASRRTSLFYASAFKYSPSSSACMKTYKMNAWAASTLFLRLSLLCGRVWVRICMRALLDAGTFHRCAFTCPIASACVSYIYLLVIVFPLPRGCVKTIYIWPCTVHMCDCWTLCSATFSHKYIVLRSSFYMSRLTKTGVEVNPNHLSEPLIGSYPNHSSPSVTCRHINMIKGASGFSQRQSLDHKP